MLFGRRLHGSGVLSADLEALRRVAADTEAAFAVTIAVPAEIRASRKFGRRGGGQSADLEGAQRDSVSESTQLKGTASRSGCDSYLSTLAELDVPSGTAHGRIDGLIDYRLPQREIQESLLVRAERYLASLSPGRRCSQSSAIHLAAAVTLATPELASLAVRDLQAEIGRINRDAKRQAAIADRLRELDVRAGSLGDPELLREVLFVQGRARRSY